MNTIATMPNCDTAHDKPVYWQPIRSGDYAKDCEAGKTAAERMLAQMREDEDPIPFLAAFRKACLGGVVGGFEIGFATAIGIATL